MSCLFSLLGTCSKHCSFLHYNLVSVNQLHNEAGKQNEVQFGNTFIFDVIPVFSGSQSKRHALVWWPEVSSSYLLPWDLFIPAAAKSLQSCPTLCDPIDGLLPGSSVPGILQARTLEWVAISFSNAWKWKVKVKSLICVQLFVAPWTAAYQAPSSRRFSRQEYWSGVPLPTPLCSSMHFDKYIMSVSPITLSNSFTSQKNLLCSIYLVFLPSLSLSPLAPVVFLPFP